MPYSSQTYTADGTTSTYTVTFGYLSKGDVTVNVNGVPKTFTWPTDTSIKLDAVPSAGQVILISRVTPISNPAVDYIDGANLTEADLDKGVRQDLYAVQELTDLTNVWISYAQGVVSSGGSMPPVNAISSFLVSNGTSWVVKTLADTKTILGITAAGAYTTIPDPAGFPAFLYTDGGTYSWKGISPARDALGLGSLALHEPGDYAILALNPPVDNTTTGSVVTLFATSKLPALDGSLLTGIIVNPKYVRVEGQTAYNVEGGTYPVANSWVQRALTTVQADEIGGGLVTLASNTITVPAGTYRYRARSNMIVPGVCRLRVTDSVGSVLVTGQGRLVNNDEACVEASGTVTFPVARGVKVEVFSTGVYANVLALGVPHGVSAEGNNIYTVLELWKLP
jgi:hypothetical protein